MKVLKARYENGIVRLNEPAPEPGPKNVKVIFLESDEERWDEIISDPAPRPALDALMEEALDEHRAGKSLSLDPDKL